MATAERALTIEQFAAERGLVSTADVDSHIHAGLRSAPTTKTYSRWNRQRLVELQDARDATTAAYLAEIASGAIRSPSSAEQLLSAASGHPDNASTQAAQRVLAKRQARSLSA